MPTYEWRCLKCASSHTKKLPMEGDAKDSYEESMRCLGCGSEAFRRVFHAPTIHFDAPGFYSTRGNLFSNADEDKVMEHVERNIEAGYFDDVGLEDEPTQELE